MVRPNGVLIIGGQEFNVNAPVVNWHESGWNAMSERCIPTKNDDARKCVDAGGKQYPYGPPPLPYTQRFSTRPNLRAEKWRGGLAPSYEAVKASVKQFVIHHDGCTSADMCFSVLQNERGLSCHFLLDNDGTIYQTIDLGLMAYHASDWNLYSIGVELCNRGDAFNVPNFYDNGRAGPKRNITPCKINGNTMKAFDYTPAQIDSFSRLCRELLRLLPNLPAEYPQSSPGEALWDTLRDAPIKRESFIGYAQILEVFKITKVGNVAGCKVTEGVVKRGCGVRLLRDNVVIHQGTLSTLKRFKDEVREVKAGLECGMAFENYQDIRQGDQIECYVVEEVAATL